MKHRFRSLTWVVMAAAAGAVWLLEMEARSQGLGDRGREVVARGQQLVAESARRVASEAAISAEMRYRIDAFGHELVGTGTYLQYGAGPEKLLRLDLRMQVGDKAATVQEIRGAESYWVRRDVPPSPPSLGRVDLNQLRKSIAAGTIPTAGDVLPQGEWIMLGGLARLITALDQNFSFGLPRAEELQFQAADGKSTVKLPIWVVAGEWKPDRLAALTAR